MARTTSPAMLKARALVEQETTTPLAEIARRVGLSKSAVQGDSVCRAIRPVSAKRVGMPTKPMREAMEVYVAGGVSVIEAAFALGVSESALRAQLKKAGVPVKKGPSKPMRYARQLLQKHPETAAAQIERMAGLSKGALRHDAVCREILQQQKGKKNG